MNKVCVIFEGTPNKKYYYNTRLDLMEGAFYDITADNHTTYNNIAFIWAIEKGKINNFQCREITGAKLVKAPRKPEKKYKKIIVNHEKETVCIVWKDGTKTVMRPQPGDTFDAEKGIALAFMKKCYDNRGCFNDAFKDIEEV